MRGKLITVSHPTRNIRSIPACAGETDDSGVVVRAWSVYPRVCGGNAEFYNKSLFFVGLSPRVRGKPVVIAESAILERSIPACAGETLAFYGFRL